MKLFSLILILFLALSSPCLAADITYGGTLSGVECTACKKTIAKALGKLKGVKTIRIVKGKGETHRLEVLTDGSNTITRADATTALKKAEHYKILSWSKLNK